MKYKCSKGHEFESWRTPAVATAGSGEHFRLCWYCYIEHLRASGIGEVVEVDEP